MKAGHFMGLLFTCAMASPIAQAEDNPFIPADPGGSIGQIERRLNDLEMRVQQAEMRTEEEMIDSQFPGVRMDGTGNRNKSTELKSGDIVLGEINGDCLVKRKDAADREQVMAIPNVSRCVTPDQPVDASAPSNNPNRQR